MCSWKIGLAAAGLQLGDLLAFFVQLDNQSGSVSFNNGFSSTWLHDPKIRSAYGPFQQQAKPYRSNDNWRQKQFPLLIVGYQDGAVKGNGHMGLSGSSSGDRFTLTNTDRARQVIPMTMSGKAMKRIYVRWMRLSTNTAHGLKLQLRRAGGSPGGSSEEGTLLFEGIIPASSVTQGDGSRPPTTSSTRPSWRRRRRSRSTTARPTISSLCRPALRRTTSSPRCTGTSITRRSV